MRRVPQEVPFLTTINKSAGIRWGRTINCRIRSFTYLPILRRFAMFEAISQLSLEENPAFQSVDAESNSILSAWVLKLSSNGSCLSVPSVH